MQGLGLLGFGVLGSGFRVYYSILGLYWEHGQENGKYYIVYWAPSEKRTGFVPNVSSVRYRVKIMLQVHVSYSLNS